VRGNVGALAALGLLVTVTAGCLATTLPADPRWRGGGCLGTGTDAVLHGSPSDPRVTWATIPRTGVRVDVVWPVGYSARFVPALELLDEQGHVVGREGDLIIGWCRTAETPEGVPIWVEADGIRPRGWEPGDE